MKTYKKILSLLVLVFVFTSAFLLISKNVGAQTSPQFEKSTYALPNVYVSKIKLAKDTYSPGDNLSGTVDINNQGGNVASDLYYIISTVGLNDTGTLANVTYSQGKFGPITLNGNEVKTIDLSNYHLGTLPKDSHSGILVRIVTKDLVSLGWVVTPIKVTAGASILQPSDVSLSLINADGIIKTSLQAGLTVSDSDKLEFNALLLNPNKVSGTLIPKISFVDKSLTPISNSQTVTGTPIKLLSNATSTSLALGIPISSLSAGVYLAKIDLVDSTNISRIPELFARFIVKGNIAEVDTVYTNTVLPIKSGDLAHIDVKYTGTPVNVNNNILTSEKASSSSNTSFPAKINISLYNENGLLVGQQSLNKNINLVGFISTDIPMTGDAQNLSSEVTITAGDNSAVVASYKGSVIYDKDFVVEKALDTFSQYDANKLNEGKFNSIVQILFVTIISILIILAVIFFSIKKYKLASLVLILAILAGSYLTWNIRSAGASGFIYNNQSGGMIITGNLPTHLAVDSTFTANATISAFGCNNTPDYIDASWNFNGQTGSLDKTKLADTKNAADHDAARFGVFYDVYLGEFTTPSNTGTYNLSMESNNYWPLSGWECGFDAAGNGVTAYFTQCKNGKDNNNFKKNKSVPPWYNFETPLWRSPFASVSGYWPIIVTKSPEEGSCTGPDGSVILNGQSKVYYQSSSAEKCSDVAETRTCTNGVLSGSFTYPSCGGNTNTGNNDGNGTGDGTGNGNGNGNGSGSKGASGVIFLANPGFAKGGICHLEYRVGNVNTCIITGIAGASTAVGVDSVTHIASSTADIAATSTTVFRLTCDALDGSTMSTSTRCSGIPGYVER